MLAGEMDEKGFNPMTHWTVSIGDEKGFNPITHSTLIPWNVSQVYFILKEWITNLLLLLNLSFL